MRCIVCCMYAFILSRISCSLFLFRVRANRTQGSWAPCRSSVVEKRTEREDRKDKEGETRQHIILIMLCRNIYVEWTSEFLRMKKKNSGFYCYEFFVKTNFWKIKYIIKTVGRYF